MADVVVHGHLHLHDGAIVLRQRNVDDGVGDLVGQLIGMPRQYRFRKTQPGRTAVGSS
jgi:hypothetical protein